jgi:DNA helicase-2/ATP-dependent DNA helicase PcrA
MENKLIIASAGAGKTTYIINKALECKTNVLITTFTIENEAEIRKKINDRKGCIPKHITIETWFSFLLRHGIKPYQGTFNKNMFNMKINGLSFVEKQSAIKYTFHKNGKDIPVYYTEDENFLKYYFDKNHKIYSDKVSRFTYKSNEACGGLVISRISRIFPNIFIDEVQDLSGYDLELINLFFRSKSNVILVGDPRQVTYYTHREKINSKYRNGNIQQYIIDKCRKRDNIIIDNDLLKKSHRNNAEICAFSSNLYPKLPISEPCSCIGCHPIEIVHQGVFAVFIDDLYEYLQTYNPVQLGWNKNVCFNNIFDYNTFGMSKGKTYKRVSIFPTESMNRWLINHNCELTNETRAKLYVAITRARYSVAFVINDIKQYKRLAQMPNIHLWKVKNE